MLNQTILESLDYHDVQKYLSPGYMRIRLPDKAKSTWVYISTVSSSPGIISGKLRLGLRNSLEKYYPLSEVVLDFTFPKSGMYNFQNSVMFVRKIPARTPLITVNSTTISISPLFGIRSPGLELKDQRFRFAVQYLEELFPEIPIPVIYDLNIILKQLKKSPNCLCRIADRDFAISIPLVSSFPALWYRGRIVGKIKPKNHIQVTNSLYFQEVYDKWTPQGIKVDLC